MERFHEQIQYEVHVILDKYLKNILKTFVCVQEHTKIVVGDEKSFLICAIGDEIIHSTAKNELMEFLGVKWPINELLRPRSEKPWVDETGALTCQ